VAATFVGDGVEAGLVAADRLGLLTEPVGGALELLSALNLNHVKLPSQTVYLSVAKI
jgi:hypothetical protein